MAKKNKKSELKSDEPTATNPPNAEAAQPENVIDEKSSTEVLTNRYAKVDPKLVFAMLEKLGQPTDGEANERTDRLSSYYAHNAQQKKIKLCECQPDDAADPLGCVFLSDQTLAECPFCGKGGEVIVAPKAPPKADAGIESTVAAAGQKVEDQKKADAVAKISSKDVRAKKKARNADPSTDAPTDDAKSDLMVSASPGSQALDLPSEHPTGTIADYDRLNGEMHAIIAESEKGQALAAWDLGVRLAEMDIRKLWCLVKHEDGTCVFPNFNSYCAKEFGWSPGSTHAALLMRVAKNMPRENAKLIGISKAKTIIDTDFPDDGKQLLIAFASKKGDDGKLIHSVTDLRVKIQEMKTARLPPAPPAPPADTPDANEEEGDDIDLDDDDDGEDEPTSSAKPSTAPKDKPKPVQMVSVNFESKKFTVPLVIKGSQVKPAKKLPDEPHGTLQVPGGTKVHFKVTIGDDGQIAIEGTIETPY